MPRLHDGPWKLRFADDYSEYGTEWFGDAATGDASTPVTVAGSAAVTVPETRLTGGVRPAPAGHDPTGVVRDEQGRPAMGVEVGLRAVLRRRAAEPGRMGGHRPRRSLLPAGARPDRTAVVQGPGRGLAHPGRRAALPGRPAAGPPPGRRRAHSATPGQITTGVDVTVRPWGGIRGVVTDAAGQPLDDVTVTVNDVLGPVRRRGEHLLRRPVLHRRAASRGPLPAELHQLGRPRDRWYSDASNPAEAQLVAPRPGEFAVANVALDSSLRARTSPAISGTLLVGRLLSASTGRWNLAAGDVLPRRVAAWQHGGGHRTVVRRATAADAGAWPPPRASRSAPDEAARRTDSTGTALSAPTARARTPRRTWITGKAKRRTVRLAGPGRGARRERPGRASATDLVVGRATLKAGRATLTLKKQRPGKHRYTASYAGTATVAASAATAAVKVRR